MTKAKVVEYFDRNRKVDTSTKVTAGEPVRRRDFLVGRPNFVLRQDDVPFQVTRETTEVLPYHPFPGTPQQQAATSVRVDETIAKQIAAEAIQNGKQTSLTALYFDTHDFPARNRQAVASRAAQLLSGTNLVKKTYYPKPGEV